MSADKEQPEKLLKDFLHGLIGKSNPKIAEHAFNHASDRAVSVMEDFRNEQVSFLPILRKDIPMPLYECATLDFVAEHRILLQL